MYRFVSKETGTVNYLVGVDRVSVTKEGAVTVWPSGNGGAPITVADTLEELQGRYPAFVSEFDFLILKDSEYKK